MVTTVRSGMVSRPAARVAVVVPAEMPIAWPGWANAAAARAMASFSGCCWVDFVEYRGSSAARLR